MCSLAERRAANYRTLRIWPPSTCTVAPVMYDAASESRNAPTRPNSSVSPYRPRGIAAIARLRLVGRHTLLLRIDLVELPHAIGIDAAGDDLIDADASAASSIASVLASAETDARNTVDSPRFGIGSFTDDDVETRIAPPPRFCM